MGIISLEKIDCVYWLGRYAERVFTSTNYYTYVFDRLIDTDKECYKEYCHRLDIPDIYQDGEDFADKYLYDLSNPDSLYANMSRAFDNAIIIREELSSDVLAYIHLALDKFKFTRGSDNIPLILQEIRDYLYAFWGSADDFIISQDVRNILKCGRYAERVDIHIRMGASAAVIDKELSKLASRIHRINVPYNHEGLETLQEIIAMGDEWQSRYQEALQMICTLFPTL